MTDTLSVQVRTVFGKKTVPLRSHGIIPAVLYGPDLKRAISLSVDAADFQKIFAVARHTTPITLAIQDETGTEKRKALISAVATDPVRGAIQHIDFYQFSATKKIKINVPVVLVGEAPAQKLGALIMKNVEAVEIECSPLHIPEHIAVDVSGLTDFDQTIYAHDLALPDGVHAHIDGELPIVSVVAPLSEAELAAMEAKATEPLQEPELAGKKPAEKEVETGEATEGKQEKVEK